MKKVLLLLVLIMSTVQFVKAENEMNIYNVNKVAFVSEGKQTNMDVKGKLVFEFDKLKFTYLEKSKFIFNLTITDLKEEPDSDNSVTFKGTYVLADYSTSEVEGGFIMTRNEVVLIIEFNNKDTFAIVGKSE